MPDYARIEELRRRVLRDPASIAFAQLAEEFRRAGQFAEAVDTCRAGLTRHPGYLSARVTLGRALIELEQLDEAQAELEHVLTHAQDNLAAIRGMAHIHHRRGDLDKALDQYKAAQALARNDPELEETIRDLTRRLAPARGAHPADGLSLEQMQSALAQPVPAAASQPDAPADHAAPPRVTPEHPDAPVYPEAPMHPDVLMPAAARSDTLVRLEAFLNAIYAVRAQRRA